LHTQSPLVLVVLAFLGHSPVLLVITAVILFLELILLLAAVAVVLAMAQPHLKMTAQAAAGLVMALIPAAPELLDKALLAVMAVVVHLTTPVVAVAVQPQRGKLLLVQVLKAALAALVCLTLSMAPLYIGLEAAAAAAIPPVLAVATVVLAAVAVAVATLVLLV
jgi:hypothetical protein